MGKEAIIKIGMYILTQVLRKLDARLVSKWMKSGVDKLIELSEQSENKIDDMFIPMLQDLSDKLEG